MNTVEAAIQDFAEATGLRDLRLDSGGNAALAVEGGPTVYLMKVGDSAVELVARILPPGTTVGPAGLRRALAANASPGDVGRGRLAVDPSDLALLYEERIDVSLIGPGEFGKRFEAFVQSAARWASPEFVEYLLAPETEQTTDPDDVVDDDDTPTARPEPDAGSIVLHL